MAQICALRVLPLQLTALTKPSFIYIRRVTSPFANFKIGYGKKIAESKQTETAKSIDSKSTLPIKLNTKNIMGIAMPNPIKNTICEVFIIVFL